MMGYEKEAWLVISILTQSIMDLSKPQRHTSHPYQQGIKCNEICLFGFAHQNWALHLKAARMGQSWRECNEFDTTPERTWLVSKSITPSGGKKATGIKKRS